MKEILISVVAMAVVSAGCSSGTESLNAAEATGRQPANVQSDAHATKSGTQRKSPQSPARRKSARVDEFREVLLPAGTVLRLQLWTPIASDSAQVEDSVRATLRDGVTLDGALVVPAGAEVIGYVTEVERSGRVKGRARVVFRFTRLRHDSDTYDIRTDSIERVAAATKGEDATKIGIGAGAGAALGAMLGGGSGAAKGAAIGAAAGTGAVLATRGEEVRVEAGETVDTSLTAAVPVRVRLN